ncbi:MAG: hypothetical protein QOK16_2723 [Solirubrobacteraceae bacterium]|nr:hypothetical protein [Solirubrobacteraceae bacterium]
MKLARPLAAIGTLALAAAAPAAALPDDPDREHAAGNPTPLEQAREESGIQDAPRSRYDLPAGVLRLTPSELLAANQQDLDFSVTLDRDVADGVLELTLPSRWVGRSGVSELRYGRVAETGRASGAGVEAGRGGRVVRFAFSGAVKGASGSLKVADEGIPAGRYELPYRWSEAGSAANSTEGKATAIFYAPVREQAEGAGARDWRYLLRDTNVTNDTVTQSETFLTAVPGNRQRFIVGVNNNNAGGGYNAWITNNGGTSFTKAPVSPSLDAPAESGPEAGDLCCDPMSAADAAGNLWYGGVSKANGAGNPSRIVVTRLAAPAGVAFGTTVGLRERTGTGAQDKPMMTIDNSPSSPAFGRLYVVWDEVLGGIDIVMSQCDTRPGGVLNAANCDNADNWTAPIDVTPGTGSYIYADVAVGPDGKVYVVWWDYSATNAIRGDACEPASQNCASAAGWGTPQTIATLDATSGTPISFACPILAQPGGRASPSPQVDVDRSGGSNNGRVYVTWGDLRAGSGTTRCNNPPSNPAQPPAATHLTWDTFVASASGGLPGSADPSRSVAIRLLTDGEAGGQANSDDWFAWLAVDQTNGQAWADFYSTREDAERKTTQFYVRSVTPGPGGHLLGALRRVSSAPSNYSAFACCGFGNDYGDYVSIDATQGVALPVWSDKRAGIAGEAFVDTVLSPFLVPDAQMLDDSRAVGGDGDGVLERTEAFRLTKLLRNSGTAAATGVTSTLTAPATAGLTFTQARSSYPDIAVGAAQGNATAFTGSMAADAPCGSPVTMSLQLTTATEPALVPVSIPTGCDPPTPPPAPPMPPPVDSSIVFWLKGASPQRPLRKRAGIVVTLSCPRESCRATVKGTVTVPARARRGKAKKISLRRAKVVLAKGRPAKRRFTVSKKLRSQIMRALRSKRTRSNVKALMTATAVDAAGNKATKKLTIKVRR